MSSTKEEYVQEYARRSRLSVEELERLWFTPRPCICLEEECKGWQMTVPKAHVLGWHWPSIEAFGEGGTVWDYRRSH